VVNRPSINTVGTTYFGHISLPANGSPWSDNVGLQGQTKFNIAYGDGDYVFFDQFSSPDWRSNSPEVLVIPLQDILLSPFNIAVLIVLGALYVASKQYLKTSNGSYVTDVGKTE
jgi:hypothetical protein